MNEAETQTAGGVHEEIILVVDDTPANLKLLTSMLSTQGYRVHVAPNGRLAIQSVQEQPPALILLDVLMPGIDGFEVCRRLQLCPASAGIPIIFLSALDGTGSKTRAFAAGGVDYVTKPFEEIEVLARVKTHMRMRRMQLLLEEKNHELARLATIDPLTGLLNRRSFLEQGHRCLNESLRYATPCCLAMLDIDHFKAINDRFGHETGDSVLQEIACRIKAQLRTPDQLGRWGGEEFTLLLPQTDITSGVHLVERLRQAIAAAPFATATTVTASFGITAFNPGDTLETLCKRADQALYMAKGAGRNRIQCSH